jgi:hypothetical protein
LLSTPLDTEKFDIFCAILGLAVALLRYDFALFPRLWVSNINNHLFKWELGACPATQRTQ